MGDFDVALEEGAGEDWFREFVANGHRVGGSRRDGGSVVGAVGEFGALSFGVSRGGETLGFAVFRNVGRGKFEVGLLFEGGVCRGHVGRERV